MKGYKVFNPDWTCRGFQYKVGETYEIEDKPKCCYMGFHFCLKASDCFSYYDFNSNNKVAEVEALGDIDSENNNSKHCSNKIRILRELTWQEVLELVNTGKDCTGLYNSGNYNSGNKNCGDYNSGDWNSGNYNSGNYNSGNKNCGDYNSGNKNCGDYNSGNYNSGNYNSGNKNSGNCNSGDYNSGDWNSGNYNSGNYNSGNYNSGNKNSGNKNSGNYNSGDCNSGDWNSGNYNSGNGNSGDWNKTCFSNGCFNTQEPKIFIFNKLSDLTYRDWLNSKAKYILNQIPLNVLSWIWEDEMSDDEKQQHPEYTVTGGFLKHVKKETERQIWWDKLSTDKKDAILNIPNFDKKIFKEITGINVES